MHSKANDWTIYRTRFLIKAKQLDAPLVFTDPLGREHSGRKGDYLVESSDGLQRIAPREIFEDIYVPMDLAADPWPLPSEARNDLRSSVHDVHHPAHSTPVHANPSHSNPVHSSPDSSPRPNLHQPPLNSRRATANRSFVA